MTLVRKCDYVSRRLEVAVAGCAWVVVVEEAVAIHHRNSNQLVKLPHQDQQKTGTGQ